MSVLAYQTALEITEEPRDTEYRLFASITRSLMDAENHGRAAYIGAVHWNRRLWLTLQSDLMGEDNRLPEALKAQLISLSIWVDKHSSKVLRGDAELGPLIAVNRSIMEGLGAGR